MSATAQIIPFPLPAAIRPVARERSLLTLWLRRWRERRALRRDLLSQPDEVLRDFGLTRKRAEILANKPFWRA